MLMDVEQQNQEFLYTLARRHFCFSSKGDLAFLKHNSIGY